MNKTKTKNTKTKRNALQPGETITLLALGLLDPSATNRPNRSGFDAKSLGELAESMRGPGIIEPLIVRPHPKDAGRYELVCGERRWTAAKLIKLAGAPCIIRPLDDATARKVQVIENLQREGLHPVEEAQGYAEMLELKDPAGKPLNTIDSIGKDIGKSPAFVYGRLKLLEMPKVALEASLSGKLIASIALLIARIPDQKLARTAALEVLDHCGSGDDEKREQRALDPENDPMSYRDAKDHIQGKYMKRLRKTKFDQEDADLVPVELVNDERRSGGKCSDCPWRTGNLRLLLPGEAQDRFRADWQPIAADVCTNPTCFKKKTDVAWRLANAKAKDQGHTLLRDGKASQIFTTDGKVQSSEYVELRAVFPGEKKKTWEDVLGDKLPDNLVQARDPKQKVRFLLDRDTAAAAAKAAGRTLPKEFTRTNGNGNGGYSAADQANENAKRQANRQLHTPIALDLFTRVLGKAEAEPTANWWRWMVRAAIADRYAEAWADLLNHKNVKALEEWIDTAKTEQLRALLVAATVVGDPHGYDGEFVNYEGEITSSLLDACEFYGIPHKKIVEDRTTEARIAAKAEAEKAKLKEASDKAEAAAKAASVAVK